MKTLKIKYMHYKVFFFYCQILNFKLYYNNRTLIKYYALKNGKITKSLNMQKYVLNYFRN